jgi:hypothetical protein
MEIIRISCDVQDFAHIDELHILQGELKSLSKENYAKLKDSILRHGITMPIHVWDDGVKFWILDGTQRKLTLQSMEGEGYQLPKIPIVKVLAPSLQEAKAILLSMVSQYGHLETQALYEFMNSADLDIKIVEERYDLPNVDMEKFKVEYFSDPVISEEKSPIELQESDDEKADAIPEKIEPRVKAGECYKIGSHKVFNGDCLEVLKTLPDNSVDSLVTDPPAGINFMGKDWDSNKGGRDEWIQWLTLVNEEN